MHRADADRVGRVESIIIVVDLAHSGRQIDFGLEFSQHLVNVFLQ
jgi:hypothetical protein